MTPYIILFIASFMYGPLKLLTHSSLFKHSLAAPIQSISPYVLRGGFIALLDNVLWIGALFYQTFYWLDHFGAIPNVLN